MADIDGEIEHARRRSLITVIPRRRQSARVQTHHRVKQ
ncbi:hypothetical protein MYXE_20880 [Mycobacterium xenopi]|uniref:Uncharacterized protein n=1 Tax=Mycobacterium xenopi TaxID=1789 RepID=A0AAD1M0R5_MYCXE|nr:hypothetical protein MYXE_20880 [Mycobacterium xenopi]